MVRVKNYLDLDQPLLPRVNWFFGCKFKISELTLPLIERNIEIKHLLYLASTNFSNTKTTIGHICVLAIVS